jgi:hypothetical protein
VTVIGSFVSEDLLVEFEPDLWLPVARLASSAMAGEQARVAAGASARGVATPLVHVGWDQRPNSPFSAWISYFWPGGDPDRVEYEFSLSFWNQPDSPGMVEGDYRLGTPDSLFTFGSRTIILERTPTAVLAFTQDAFQFLVDSGDAVDEAVFEGRPRTHE